MVCALAEVQKPQPGQRPLAQSHPQVVSGFSPAVGELWEPPGCLGMERPWGRGVSPVPPGSLSWRELCSSRGIYLRELIHPQNLGSGQHCCHHLPAPALSCPGVTLSLPPGAAEAPCPRRLLWLLQTDTRTVCASPALPAGFGSRLSVPHPASQMLM